jgi:hypothetical protein
MICHFKYLQVRRSQLFVTYGDVFRLFGAETRRVRARLQVQKRHALFLGFRSIDLKRATGATGNYYLGSTFSEGSRKTGLMTPHTSAYVRINAAHHLRTNGGLPISVVASLGFRKSVSTKVNPYPHLSIYWKDSHVLDHQKL